MVECATRALASLAGLDDTSTATWGDGVPHLCKLLATGVLPGIIVSAASTLARCVNEARLPAVVASVSPFLVECVKTQLLLTPDSRHTEVAAAACGLMSSLVRCCEGPACVALLPAVPDLVTRLANVVTASHSSLRICRRRRVLGHLPCRCAVHNGGGVAGGARATTVPSVLRSSVAATEPAAVAAQLCDDNATRSGRQCWLR